MSPDAEAAELHAAANYRGEMEALSEGPWRGRVGVGVCGSGRGLGCKTAGGNVAGRQARPGRQGTLPRQANKQSKQMSISGVQTEQGDKYLLYIGTLLTLAPHIIGTGTCDTDIAVAMVLL